MADRTTIEAQIADDLARSDLSSQITNGVTAAIRAYRFERFGFNEAYRVTATLSVSAAFIDLTTLSVRFRKLDRVRLQRNTTDYIDMYARDYDWLMSRQDAYALSMPLEYAMFNNAIHFDAYADQTYTMLIDGIKELTTNATASYSTGDTCAWFNDARELIRHRAKREVYAHVLKDMELASAAMAAEQDAYKMLKAETAQQTSTGFIRPTEF